MTILSIDPGPEQSAYVVWDGERIYEKAIESNHRIIMQMTSGDFKGFPVDLVIEQVKCYGMTVADSVFDTVFWTGRFCEAWSANWHRIPRMQVKMHLCHNSRAKDSNIRQALIDRFGEPGTKKEPGLTYGLKRDLWQAFALAVTWHDQNGANRRFVDVE